MSHYGIGEGDWVSIKTPFTPNMGARGGTVIYLYPLDHNRVRVRLNDGREMDAVAEWCTVIRRAADGGNPAS